MACRHHLTQLRQARDQLEDAGIVIKVITFDDDVLARNYAKSQEVPWPLLVDRERRAYQAYGMLKGSWWDLYSPISILKYLWLIVRGQMPGQPGEDWSQLGGDVLIDPQGVVRLHHRSLDPHDRPSVDRILEVVRRSA